MKSAAEKNAELAQKMIEFVPTDDSQLVRVCVGSTQIQCSQKKTAYFADKIKSAHRTFPRGAYKRVSGDRFRFYPKFEPGMTTAEYIAAFVALEAHGNVLPIDMEALGDRPAALYENGALDFDVIEERDFEEQAAQDVAQVLADAVAAVAIDTAQTTARADELAEVAHTQADTVAETCADTMTSGGKTDLCKYQDKPDAATLINAGIHPAVADTISRCGISAYGPLAQTEIRTKLAVAMGGTPGHTNTGHATPAQRSSAPGAAGGAGGQRVAGKSGRWSAVLHTTPAGLPGMVYTGPDGTPTAHEFDTGRQRMAALQRLAQSADKSNDFPNPGDEYSVYAGAWLRMKFLYKKEKTTTSNELYYFSNGSIATVVKVDELHERVKATTEADAGPSGTLTAPHTPTPSEPNGPDTHGVCAAGATDYTHPLKTLGGDYTDPLKTLTGDVHAKTANQPSHPRNIVPRGGLHIVEDAFEAWTFHQEKTGRFGFVMYLGKQSKPYAYYAYATEAKRDAGFERHAQQARDILASKAKRKTEDRAKLDAGHGLQVGDVVRSSWGYDQTDVDHYQIIKVIGKRTVEVRALAVHEESTGDMSGRVAPVWGEFVGEVMRRQVDKHGNVNMLSASYGRASKIEPVAVVHGVRCYAASHYSSHA